MLDLVISIVNHNSVAPLRDCLEQMLPDLDGLDCEIYVVDNLCAERAALMLKEAFPQISVIANASIRGFGANHNQVLERVLLRTNYILVLNPDTLISGDTLRRLLQFMEADKRVAICGPRFTDEHGKTRQSTCKAHTLWKDAGLLGLYISGISRVHFDKVLAVLAQVRKLAAPKTEQTPRHKEVSPQDNRIRYCETVDGACMIIRAEALTQIGLFDERFFLYFEERDLCLRAHAQGWKIAYLPAETVTHIGAYSTRREYHRYLTVFTQSCLLFYQKHEGPAASAMLRALILAAATMSFVRWGNRYLLHPSRRKEADPWLVFSATLIKMALNPSMGKLT